MAIRPRSIPHPSKIPPQPRKGSAPAERYTVARKTYKPKKLEDGSFKIEAVEVFQLGEHRDFPFDSEWFERAVKNHQKFDKIGFAPNVIIGHGSWDNENPVFGDFQNVRLDADGVTVLVDYMLPKNVDPRVFNDFPHRSVRVNPERAYFAHVAQLGASEPHFKLPSMHIPDEFSADPEESYMVFEVEGSAEDEFAVGADGNPPAENEIQLRLRDDALKIAEEKFEAERAEFEAARTKLEAELADFRKQAAEQARIQENKFLDERKKQLASAGLCKPVLDSYFDIRAAMLFADSPLDCQVEFKNTPDGNPVTKNLREALDELETLLFRHITENSLIAPLEGKNLPFQQNPLELHSDDGETPDQIQARQADEIKQYFADKGQKQWTNEEFRLARIELGHIPSSTHKQD